MPVVYDGTRGSGRGNLFEGLKLFISLRVPQRERWVGLVEGNGGEVVKLEKHADMLIADHVKSKGAVPPAGSYSWQWIEYSVRNGILQSEDDYRIEGIPAVKASAPAKGQQRVKFTKEDDETLAKFVWDHERRGNPIKGNVIFEDLNRHYPHHTPQSWRDRWVKYVSNRPRPNLSQEDAQPDAGVRGSPRHCSSSVDNPLQSQAGPSNVNSASVESPAATPRKHATGRNKFTQEDDEILRRMIRERREIAAAQGIREDLDGNKIFKDLAAQYPNRHPWMSWRNRWVRHLNVDASVEQADSGNENEDGRSRDPAARPRQQTGETRGVPSPRIQARRTTALSSAGISSPALSTAQQPLPKSDDERLKRQQQRKIRAQAAKLLQKTWRGHVVRRDRAQLEASIVSLQSLMRGYLLRTRRAERLLDGLEANAEPHDTDQDEDAEHYEDAQEDVNPEVDGNDSSLRAQFYEDLQDYLEVSGAEIERQPVVDGREVQLWDLYAAATQQDCSIEHRDWNKVALRLGFDSTSSAECAKDLKDCYDRNLAGFEEAIGSYDDEDDAARTGAEHVSHDDEEQGLPQTSDAVTAPKEPFTELDSRQYRSSSPVAGIKRSFQQTSDSQSEFGYPSDNSNKRRRRDRGKAIPQTPKNELEFVGGSNRRAVGQGVSSPSMSRRAVGGRNNAFSVDDAEDFLNNGIHDIPDIDELPNAAPSRKQKFVEPETQDFGEENNTGYMTDEDDNSPSQQLLSEFDAISSPPPPAAVRGNGTSSANRPPFVESRLARDAHTSGSGTANINGSAKGYSKLAPQATKRSLPQQYLTEPAIPSDSRPYLSKPMPNGIASALLQLRTSTVARPATAASARSPGIAMQNSRQTVPATPTPAERSSAQPRGSARGAPTSSAPIPGPARTNDKSSNLDFGEEYVDAQFEHFTALGYGARHIGQAMEASSLQRGPMTVALQSLEAGKGLPQNVAGVWTDDDDEKLRKVRDYDRRQKSGGASSTSAGNASEKARVERYRAFLLKKHQSWYAHRMAFMNSALDDGPAA